VGAGAVGAGAVGTGRFGPLPRCWESPHPGVDMKQWRSYVLPPPHEGHVQGVLKSLPAEVGCSAVGPRSNAVESSGQRSDTSELVLACRSSVAP